MTIHKGVQFIEGNGFGRSSANLTSYGDGINYLWKDSSGYEREFTAKRDLEGKVFGFAIKN